MACTRGENDSVLQTEPDWIAVWPDGETTTNVPMPEPDEPSPGFTVPDGMEAEDFVLQAWEARVENILQANITRIEYIINHRFLAEPQIFSSADSTAIERWKALLPQLRLSVIPFEILVSGYGVTLTFYDSNTPLQLLTGHSRPDIISIDEGRIGEEWWRTGKRFRIDNFDEVGEEFMALLREMGVTIWASVEVEPED